MTDIPSVAVRAAEIVNKIRAKAGLPPKETILPADAQVVEGEEPSSLADIKAMVKELCVRMYRMEKSVDASISLAKAELDVRRKELPMIAPFPLEKKERMYRLAHKMDQVKKGMWECGTQKCMTCKFVGKEEGVTFEGCWNSYITAWKGGLKKKWQAKFGK